MARREADEHLSLVAWIQRSQRTRLVERGIETVTQFAAAEQADRLPRIGVATFDGLRAQARLQMGGVAVLPRGDGRHARLPVHRRGRPDLTRRRAGDGHVRAQPDPARRPAAAGTGRAGDPHRARYVSAGAPARRGYDDPPKRGLFINQTRWMHPDVCRFISAAIYEDRLESFTDCANQRIDAPGKLTGIGIRYVRSPTRATRASLSRRPRRSRGSSRIC